MAEKGKEENSRHTVIWQGFLTQNFFVRTSKKIQDLIGGAIIYTKSAIILDKPVKRCYNIKNLLI